MKLNLSNFWGFKIRKLRFIVVYIGVRYLKVLFEILFQKFDINSWIFYFYFEIFMKSKKLGIDRIKWIMGIFGTESQHDVALRDMEQGLADNQAAALNHRADLAKNEADAEAAVIM